AVRGAGAFFAVVGGIAVPPFMGSRSTYLRAKVGGLEGRALQAGDVLPIGKPSPHARRIAEKLKMEKELGNVRSVPWFAGLAPTGQEKALRVVRGAEFEKLTADSQRVLFSTDFAITTESDRMGYRLAGPALSFTQTADLISAAACPGTL